MELTKAEHITHDDTVNWANGVSHPAHVEIFQTKVCACGRSAEELGLAQAPFHVLFKQYEPGDGM